MASSLLSPSSGNGEEADDDGWRGIQLVHFDPSLLTTLEDDGDQDGSPSGSLLAPPSKKDDDSRGSVNMMYFFIVAWVTFLGEMSRGLVVPVLWPYLQVLDGTVQFLGFVSSGFSFARFFAAPFFGWWSNKRSHKEVMLICLVLLMAGNTLFALYPPPWLLLISRVIVGLGAGTLGQSRGYVSQVTTKEQRTRFVAYLTVSQFAGFAVTPGISILLSFVDFDLFGFDWLEADQFSSAGYVLAAIAAVSFVVVLVLFKDPPPSPTSEPSSSEQEIKEATGTRIKNCLVNSIHWIPDFFVRWIPAAWQNPDFRKILVFAGLTFATRTAVAVVETASPEITQRAFNWSPSTLSFFLCGLGVLGTGILITLPRLSKALGATMGEGLLLCLGVFSLAFGMLLMMPFQNNEMDKYTFVVGLGFTWSLGSALCQTLIISYLSRILKPDSQGVIMGWLASLGSVSRIFGALWTGFALASKGGAFVALGVPAFVMSICLCGILMIVVQTYRSFCRNPKTIV